MRGLKIASIPGLSSRSRGYLKAPRRRIRRAAASFFAAALAVGILVAGSPAALAAGEVISLVNPYPDPPACFLFAKAHGDIIQIECTSSQLQDWSMINFTTEPFMGTYEPTGELEVGSTGECINFLASTKEMYLDSCEAGDLNEQFWGDQVGYTNYDWYVSAAATGDEDKGDLWCMWATSANAGAYVNASACDTDANELSADDVWYING
jgi:hypothetical protein